MAKTAPNSRRRFYRVEGGRRPRRRLSKWLAVGGALVVSTWVLVFGETGWLHVRAEQQAVEKLRAETSRLREDTTELEARVEEIQRPASPLLERVARERYLMKREGDEVIHVLDPSADEADGDGER